MNSAPVAQLNNVNVPLKANVYFDGKVVSHTLLLQDGGKKTLGVIYAGSYSFSTGAPETMNILSGLCRVRQKGGNDWRIYKANDSFDVPGQSSFEISVEQGLVEYLCHFR